MEVIEADMEDAKEIRFRVDYVESGLPRWLIEAAFVCFLLQSASNWTPLMHFGDASPCSHVRQLANSGNFGYARQ